MTKLESIKELAYLTQVVIRLFENVNQPGTNRDYSHTLALVAAYRTNCTAPYFYYISSYALLSPPVPFSLLG